ncbi:MAG: T9SS type A sorting domain-containing protein [Psychroflexus sp.]
MKKITTLFMMFAISLIGFSQQEVVQDFESSPNVVGFEGLASATIVSDPSTAGNGNVFELITNSGAGGNPWQGAEVTLADDSVLDLTSDLTVSIDVWSDVAFSPMVKVESSEGAPAAANTQNHTGSGWETLTYTFNTGSDETATADGVYTKVVFFPNRNSDDTGWNDPILDATVYFDNITGVKTSISGDPAGNPPSTAAPTPPSLPDNEVISFYSDAYAQQPLNFDAGFCGTGSTEEIQIEGNNTILYKTNNCQGIQLDAPVDASTFTTLHFDFYVDEDADLIGSVISLKLNQTNGEGPDDDIFLDNVLTEGSTPPIVAGEWVSVEIDVDLTDFDALDEVVITAGTLGDELYYDNFYLSGGNLSSESFTIAEFKAYPNPTQSDWNVESDSNISEIKLYDVQGKLISEQEINSNQATISSEGLPTGVYFAKVESDAKNVQTIRLIKE